MRRSARTARRSLRPVALGALCVALAGSVLFFPANASAQSADITIRRIPGQNYYELAANAAGGKCDSETGSYSVALASGEDWPDALAAAALDRPLLLTRQEFLPAATRNYLLPCVSHPNAKVIILGGPAAVSEDLANALRAVGFRVDRIAGADRYETARRAAALFAPDELATVYLASGVNFADAVAAAPSVTSATPLILTTADALHDEARQFLTDPDRTVGSVTILGGHAAISAAVEEDIHSLGIETRRVAGADRYETAALLARRSFNALGCHPVIDVAVASGTAPHGGLVAGAVRGPCQPMLLTPEPASGVPELLAEFGRDWSLAIGRSVRATVTGIGPSSIVGNAAVVAVATGETPDPDNTTGSDAAIGLQDWDQLAESVVLVECLDTNGRTRQFGTGFAVGNGVQIVTSNHVVFDDRGRACPRLRASLGGTFEQRPTRQVPVALERSAPDRDLALLVMDPDAPPLPTVNFTSGSLRAGETIIVLGYPGIGGSTMTLTTGRYSGTTRLQGSIWIKTDAQIAPGNSGGPVFDDSRQLIGVATALSLAQLGDSGSVIGSLSLLVPADDVAALLAGDIGT